ncbi:MAG: sigma-54 dependent transcriptional regulator [Candidatus Sumerlaeota bacterium]|nr:sigma-54 dependent transcriptional regulator [Candidatus Sumerlaeota bacterium]
MDIVIIDDEPKMGQIIKRTLAREGYDADATTDPNQGLEWIGEFPARLVLCDLKMPEMSGIDVLERAKTLRPEIGFIIMTAYASVENTVEAFKKGVYDYITKPFGTEDLKQKVSHYLEKCQLQKENESLKALVGEKYQFENIVAESASMKDVLSAVRKVARSDVSVLLRGESGTGKEILACAIHSSGARSGRPLIKVNCGALPETLLESELFGHVRGSFTGAVQTRAGLFEEANGGAIFLDEIGDISPALQVRLLRVLQEGEFQRVGDTKTMKVNVRIIAATNRDLEKAMREGMFRQDLYYRLNVVPIFIPPLRQRPDDIPALVEFYLGKLSNNGQTFEIAPAAFDLLMRYPWPGNVRELENAIEHASVMCDSAMIGLEDLPLSMRQFAAGAGLAGGEKGMEVGQMTLSEIERQCLLEAMQRAGNNHTRAAKLLGITRRTLGYRLKKYGLKESSVS